jgi:hypothetical protein
MDEVTNSLKSFSSEIGGEQSDLVWSLTKQAAQQHMQENGTRYPYGHPLHDTNYMPLNENDVQAVKAKVQQQIDAIRGMAAREAANPGIPGTPTPGSSGGLMNGAATGPNANGLTDKQARQAQVQEVYRRTLAGLNGESISNS